MVIGLNNSIANSFYLSQLNEKDKISFYPNPADNRTTIQLTLDEKSEITIVFFDLSGKKVKEIEKQQVQAGNQQISINTDQIKDGIYLCRIQTDKWVKTARIIIKH